LNVDRQRRQDWRYGELLAVGVPGEEGVVRFDVEEVNDLSWLVVGALSEKLSSLEEEHDDETEDEEENKHSWLDAGVLSEKLNSLEEDEAEEKELS